MNTLDYNYEELTQVKKIIGNKDITTLFQPIISLYDGEVLGYEALSRGPKDTVFYSPKKLFEVARENDLLWELELVCRVKALEKYADRLEDKKLFINIAPDIIQDSKFQRGFTKELLKTYKIDPDEIIFEITENTAIKDYKKLKDVLDNYAQQGYKIALDDTGAGYSGLVLLAETHPHFMKIDMELVRDIDKNKFKQDLMRTFREFSEITNVKIIAEGIETEDELNTLIELGIHYGQGYLIQKPIDTIQPIHGRVIKVIKEISARSKLLNEGLVDEFKIGYLARKDRPLEITAGIDEANEVFSQEYTLQGIPVVKQGKAVGLLMRQKFYFQLIKRKDDDLSKKTIESVMTKLPLIVDYESPIKKVARIAMGRREEWTYDYILVSKGGSYYGVVPIIKLVEILSKAG